MREPQATSTLGHRTPRSFARRARAAATAVAAVVTLAAPATVYSQLRGAPMRAPSYGWWVSGGASAVIISSTITDGASQTTWRFGNDPLWQYRATLEKALDQFSTIGLSGGYGVVDLALGSIAGAANVRLPAACISACAATTEMWTGMAQFRSGGGPGFHTTFEASGGATVFQNFKNKADAVAIPGIARSVDLSGTLGVGFAYSLSPGMVVALVQDIGIGFHAKKDLPEDASRTWRMRNTRASVRIKLGGR